MTPIHFPQANKTFVSANADSLPAHAEGVLVTSCWHLTWRERLRLLWSGRLWAQTTSPMLGIDLVQPTLRQPQSPKP